MMTQRMRRTTGAGFTEKELRYLMERSVGRLAFVCSDMQAHIMPVSFEFDGAYFYLSGWNIKYSERFQDASPKNMITLLVDDVDSPPERLQGEMKKKGKRKLWNKEVYHN